MAMDTLDSRLIEPFILTDPYPRDLLDYPRTEPLKHSGYYTAVRRKPKIGRNDPCHCGSNKKYKNCCLQ